MSASFKIITSIVGVAGGVGGITYSTILSTDNSIKTSTASPNSYSSPAVDFSQGNSRQAQLHQLTKKGNCKVVNAHENPIFEELKIQEDDYTVIHCAENNSEVTEGDATNKWTGFFPDDLFKDSFRLLMIGTGFDLTIEGGLIAKTVDDYKIIFKSDQFSHAPLTGEGEKQELKISNKKVTTVKVTSKEHKKDKKIYLLLSQTID